MALLCCFLLIVEKIPIVLCEWLYELTWSVVQSGNSKWPPPLKHPGKAKAGIRSAMAEPPVGKGVVAALLLSLPPT